jgi:hypothetical protein
MDEEQHEEQRKEQLKERLLESEMQVRVLCSVSGFTRPPPA